MDMDLLYRIMLFLHIGGAIVAFGPTLSFSVIGGMGGREPMHANFALRVMDAIGRRRVEPVAIFVGLTGLVLIWVTRRDVFRELWLLVAIALYLTALSIATLVGAPNTKRLIEATSGPPPGAPPSGGEGSPPSGPPPGGPPPHIAALVRRGQTIGMVLALLLVSILFLMVFKPF